MKKISIYLVVLIYIFQFTQPPVYAENSAIHADSASARIVIENGAEKALLFEEISAVGEPLAELESDDLVTVFKTLDDFSFIEYLDTESNITYRGYLRNEYISHKNEDEDSQENPLNISKKQKEKTDSLESGNGDILESEKDIEETVIDEPENDSNVDANVKINNNIQPGTEVTRSQTEPLSVEIVTSDDSIIKGIALKSPTYVYDSQSKKAKKLKSYSQGSILKFKALNNNWYKATVSYNGEWVTGYIHVNDVESFPDKQTTLNGLAAKSPTNVYQSPTKGKVLRSYQKGTILKYKTLTSEWFEATVSYKGEWVTGYIHVNDVEEIFDSQKKLSGYASKNPTKVYLKASKDSNVLKSYRLGSVLKFKTFSANWFEATVYVSGKPKIGYIHIDDVTFENLVVRTNYNLSLEEALAIQLSASPQTDKNYDTYVSKEYINKDNEVTADKLNVRGGAGTNYWVVGQLKKGTKVTILKSVNNWYQIKYTENHQWVNPSSEDILYYLNPNNFINHDIQKFQFLDLSKPSGATASVLNNYLIGKGTLSGKGQAFIDAGMQNGINDVYLISHALLETGNGTSTLARGVKYNGVTVYNMFGIHAYDSCPVECGSKKAYEEGWTTPYKAIVGGAKFIDTYIYRGQNTLYKMRWNPEAMESTGQFGKQYATDIGWASKQVRTMYDLYQELDSYILTLDVPVYKK